MRDSAMDKDRDKPKKVDATGEGSAFWPRLRDGCIRWGGALVALARVWGPRAATRVKTAAVRARESQVADRTRQAAGRAGRAIQSRSRAVKEQVSAWTWPRRALAKVARRYPLLDRAWKQFVHSFSLSDRPAPKEEEKAPTRTAIRPPAARPARTARASRSRNNMRKAA